MADANGYIWLTSWPPISKRTRSASPATATAAPPAKGRAAAARSMRWRGDILLLPRPEGERAGVRGFGSRGESRPSPGSRAYAAQIGYSRFAVRAIRPLPVGEVKGSVRGNVSPLHRYAGVRRKRRDRRGARSTRAAAGA